MIEQIFDFVLLKLMPIGILSIGLPIALIWLGIILGEGLKEAIGEIG